MIYMRKIETSKPFAFFLELLLVIFFFAISATIILQVYASAIQKNQFDHDRRKAMLFAQNVIEGNQDLSVIQKEYDQNFENEGNYFQVEIVESNEDFPHYTLCIWQDDQSLQREYAYKQAYYKADAKAKYICDEIMQLKDVEEISTQNQVDIQFGENIYSFQIEIRSNQVLEVQMDQDGNILEWMTKTKEEM